MHNLYPSARELVVSPCLNCGRLGSIQLPALPFATVCSLRCERSLMAQVHKENPMPPTLRDELSSLADDADQKTIFSLDDDRSPVMQRVLACLRVRAEEGARIWYLNDMVHSSPVVRRAIADRLARRGLAVTESVSGWAISWGAK